MSRATAILKIASLAGNVVGGAASGLRTAKNVAGTVVHGLGDLGQMAGEALGVNPELARAGAQVAGLGGIYYTGKSVKDQTNQKLQELQYRMQYGNQGYY